MAHLGGFPMEILTHMRKTRAGGEPRRLEIEKLRNGVTNTLDHPGRC